MKMHMQLAHTKLRQLLDTREQVAGLYIRVHGDHLIISRREPLGAAGELEDDDRVRLTRLSGSTYGLSVKRHTGRWERTPFSGDIETMVDTIMGCMQHLVSPY